MYWGHLLGEGSPPRASTLSRFTAWSEAAQVKGRFHSCAGRQEAITSFSPTASGKGDSSSWPRFTHLYLATFTPNTVSIFWIIRSDSFRHRVLGELQLHRTEPTEARQLRQAAAAGASPVLDALAIEKLLILIKRTSH